MTTSDRALRTIGFYLRIIGTAGTVLYILSWLFLPDYVKLLGPKYPWIVSCFIIFTLGAMLMQLTTKKEADE